MHDPMHDPDSVTLIWCLAQVHMTTHQPKVKTSLPCTMPGCQEMFSRQHDRLRHEVSQHGKSCEWSCSVCRRFFSSERMLQIHKCQGQASNSRWTVPGSYYYSACHFYEYSSTQLQTRNLPMPRWLQHIWIDEMGGERNIDGLL